MTTKPKHSKTSPLHEADMQAIREAGGEFDNIPRGFAPPLTDEQVAQNESLSHAANGVPMFSGLANASLAERALLAEGLRNIVAHPLSPGPPLADPLYRVTDAHGRTVGASVHSFQNALKDADKPYLWAQNSKAGASYEGVTLVGGPPEFHVPLTDQEIAQGVVLLPDGTRQWPAKPVGGTPGALPPVPPPSVPSDWKAGQLVRHKHIPGMVPVPILEVLTSTIRLVMQDNGEDKEVQDDWQNYVNLALV